MHRGSIRDFAGKAMHTLARATINSIKDNPMMQTMHSDFFNNDSRQNIERVQNYGFTSSIIPRSKKEGGDQQAQSGSGSGGGGGGDGVEPEQEKGESAEAVMMFQAGQRNHPLAVAVDDRRHRPRIWKPGENAQYDDIGQMFLLRRKGSYHVTNDNPDYDGKKEERFALMAHVEKDKQERPKKQSSGGSGGQSQEQQKEEEDFKHEGKKINAGVRCNKKRIEFVADDEVVGYYDKENKRWVFIGEIKLGGEDASHPVYGKVGAVGKTAIPGGVGAVLINAPMPGPPTSEDKAP